jgi:hypothetical protein
MDMIQFERENGAWSADQLLMNICEATFRGFGKSRP